MLNFEIFGINFFTIKFYFDCFNLYWAVWYVLMFIYTKDHDLYPWDLNKNWFYILTSLIVAIDRYFKTNERCLAFCQKIDYYIKQRAITMI